MLLLSCSDEEQVVPVQPPPVDRIVIDGNSLAVGGYNHIFSDSGYHVVNVAVGGQSITRMIQDCIDVDSSITDGSLLIVDEVTNELFFGASADSALERLRRYCDERRRLHPSIRIAVVTPTPRSNPGTHEDFESKRMLAIAMMKSDSSFYDFLANAGEDSSIGLQGSQYDTRFYYDSVHHTQQGYAIRGQLIYLSAERVLR